MSLGMHVTDGKRCSVLRDLNSPTWLGEKIYKELQPADRKAGHNDMLPAVVSGA